MPVAAEPKKRLTEVRLPRIDPAYRYLAMLGGTGVVGLLVVLLFVVRPLGNNVLKTMRELGSEQAQVKALKQKVLDLGQLRRNYAELGDANRQRILVALPLDDDIPHLISVLETVGARAQVKLGSISPVQAIPGAVPSGGVTAGSTASVPVQVSVEGTYAQVLSFFQGVEEAPRLMDILSVSFSGSGSPIRAEVSLRAYYNPRRSS